MAEKNLGNAAFFAIKGLKKELEQLKLDVEEIKKQVRDQSSQPAQES
jgi:hypothetical protein